MRTRTVVVGFILLCLCLYAWIAFQAVAAPPGPSVGQQQLPQLKPADLVVKRVVIEKVGADPTSPHQIWVHVKNRGPGAAGASTTAVLYTVDATSGANAVSVFGVAPTPALASGAEATVEVEKQVPMDKIYFVVLADAPTAARPLGRVREGTSGHEMDNSLTVPFDIANSITQVFNNPAVP